MKNKIVLAVFLFLVSLSANAEYKIIFSNEKINLSGVVEEPPFEPPIGEEALCPNGVTVSCLEMPNGEEFEIEGKTYTVVYTGAEARAIASSACTSNVTDMSNLFYDNDSFNQDISHWDTSKVTTMYMMFRDADAFNQDISSWDVSNVNDMTQMFFNADGFDKNLNSWCVSHLTEGPYRFNDFADLFSSSEEPAWGICPQKANEVSGYSLASNGVTVQCKGMPNGATFEINNEYYRVVYSKIDAKTVSLENNKVCTSNVTDMSNLFYENDSFNQDISHWDTSNVTTMYMMFRDADAFNQDIGSWDVSNVNDMTQMFFNADGFNQNLNDWCVSQFAGEPYRFNEFADLFSSSEEPSWGQVCNF